jgi:hypothetical protein
MTALKWRARGFAPANRRQWYRFNHIPEAELLWLMALLAAPLLSMPLSVHAQEPSLRVILRPELITEIADQVLPARLGGPPESALAGFVPLRPLFVTELFYCGVDDHGDGRMIGVIERIDAPLRARSLGPSDCDRPLSTIATRELRLPAAPEWVEAARFRLTWNFWNRFVFLGLADAAPAARSGYTAPNLLQRRGFTGFPTSRLQPLTGPGRNLTFDLAVGFRRDGIVVQAYPSGSPIDPNVKFPSDDELSAQIRAAPPATNVIASAPYEFINQMLSSYSPTFNIPVTVQGLSTTLLARDLSVKGSDNQLTLSGKMISQNLAYDSRVDCAGDDLAVEQVAMETAGVNCAQPDIISWLQCHAGHGLAAALTGYYQNQPLHISTQSRPLHFTFEGIDYDVYFTALKTSSHGDMLSEAGQATLQRVSGEPPLKHD